MADEPAKTQYLLTIQGGPDAVIELPPDHYVTFGAVNPGGNPQGMRGSDLHCVRVWQGKGNNKTLRAVFCDVRGIRDLSIPLARKIAVETGSAEWKKDSTGNFEQNEKRHRHETLELDEHMEF